MDDLERIADSHALEAIRKTEGFCALCRLMARKKDDLFNEWATDKDLTKDFCKGVLTVVQSFESDVDQEIANGRDLEAAQKEMEVQRIGRGRALEGGGTGDLA